MHNRYLFKELIEEYMEVVKRHRNIWVYYVRKAESYPEKCIQQENLFGYRHI